MKKKTKIILIIIISIILLGIIFGTIDYIRIRNNKLPIFTVHTISDNVWDNYYGIGYVVVYNKECSNDYVDFTFYFSTHACFIQSDYVTKIEVIELEKCDNKAKLYYSKENENIYTYCLDKINMYNKNSSIELKYYFNIDSNVMDYIINNFTTETESSYDDGGSKLYKGDNFNILKCHTIDGNNDIYIGNKNMGYFNNFCK